MKDHDSTVTLEWPTQKDLRAVGRLVIAGVAARTRLGVDRVEELGLSVDALTHAETDGDRLQLEVDVHPDRLVATVGAFLRDPTRQETTGRIVSTLVDELAVDQRDDGFWVALTVALPNPE